MTNKLAELIKKAKTAMRGKLFTCELERNMFVADYLIANGVTVNEWRPASEPPKENGKYLCIYKFGVSRITFMNVLNYYATDTIPHFQHTLSDSEMIVLYWMPLPEMPKGVE